MAYATTSDMSFRYPGTMHRPLSYVSYYMGFQLLSLRDHLDNLETNEVFFRNDEELSGDHRRTDATNSFHRSSSVCRFYDDDEREGRLPLLNSITLADNFIQHHIG